MRAPHVFRGLAAELRAHGVEVRKVRGWKERGRDGDWDPRAFMEHHDASNRTSGPAPALGIITNGRADLEGPLSNFYVGRDAVVYIVAAGRCNHAGAGGPLKGIPEDSGNAYSLGCEIANDGIGEPYPADQMRAVRILTAVCLRRVRRGRWRRRLARWAIAHKEWTPRKIDPSFNMGAFRRALRRTFRRWRRKGER